MSPKLENLDPHVAHLVECNYAIAFAHGFMLVRDIPYVDEDGDLQVGVLAVKLNAAPNGEILAHNHQAHFSGSLPHGGDGKPLDELSPQVCSIPLEGSEAVLRLAFSNKPSPQGWNNIAALVDHYANIIAGPAENRFKVSRFTGRSDLSEFKSKIFRYGDALSWRTDILDLSAKLATQIVAVIGAGGTGSYVVDLLARSAVSTIKVFDFDNFEVANSFRMPGRVADSDYGKNKAILVAERYSDWRFGVEAIPEGVTEESEELLTGVTFAFVCVDSGSARLEIARLLQRLAIPFIDVGIGMDRGSSGLHAMARMTLVRPDCLRAQLEKGILPTIDAAENEYDQNIQTPEMNAINACLAVIKFKQELEFYDDRSCKTHVLFDALGFNLIGENYDG